MLARYILASALTLFTSLSLAHPVAEHPSPPANAIEEHLNATTVHILKRAGAVFNACTVPNTAALTFDDGPYNFMVDIGNTLTAAGAKGTFFLNGNNWGCIYNYVNPIRTVYNQGHMIGSHTWGHLNLATLAWDPIHDEMWRVELALQRIIGAQPAWMRPPYGSYNQLVQDAANIRGQNLALWDLDSGDSTGASIQSQKSAYTTRANQHPSTILTLNHETYASTAYDLLPHAISTLQNAGYNLVTVAECLNLPAYQWVGSPQTQTPDWHC